MRRKTVRLKLNTIRSEFDSKVVLMVDDSIGMILVSPMFINYLSSRNHMHGDYSNGS